MQQPPSTTGPSVLHVKVPCGCAGATRASSLAGGHHHRCVRAWVLWCAVRRHVRRSSLRVRRAVLRRALRCHEWRSSCRVRRSFSTPPSLRGSTFGRSAVAALVFFPCFGPRRLAAAAALRRRRSDRHDGRQVDGPAYVGGFSPPGATRCVAGAGNVVPRPAVRGADRSAVDGGAIDQRANDAVGLPRL